MSEDFGKLIAQEQKARQKWLAARDAECNAWRKYQEARIRAHHMGDLSDDTEPENQ